jgi:nucleotide-binding universal stress UspA family protein
MLRVSKILFPVDFSERCTAAASQVAAWALHFKAKLTLLHVLETPPVWYADLAADELEALVPTEELLRENRSRLDLYLRDEFRRIPEVERVVEKGNPAQVIADYARGAGLVMMPTHGRGPFRRFLLGSVTAKVLHDVQCPVWTDVHVNVPIERVGFKSVVCAVDQKPDSASAIRWAVDFAASHGAELTLVHAIPAIAGPIHPEVAHLCGFLIQDARQYIADLQREAGTVAKVCIQGGNIAETIRSCAVQRGAGLVVIGRGRMGEALGGLRSNAYAIIRESACPVVRV